MENKDLEKIIRKLEEEGFVGQDISPTWDFNKNRLLKGVLVDKQSNVGRNNSNLYTVELKTGERVSVWGSAVIDSHLATVSVGEEIVILYLGKTKNPKTNRTFKNFKIMTRGPIIKKEAEENDEIEERPF